jgi:hypothetical protein
MTKATLITWNSVEHQTGNLELNKERDDKLAEMVAEGKTDGVANRVTPAITIREWIDQAAAEEFRDFILALEEKYGPELIKSIVIEDAS